MTNEINSDQMMANGNNAGSALSKVCANFRLQTRNLSVFLEKRARNVQMCTKLNSILISNKSMANSKSQICAFLVVVQLSYQQSNFFSHFNDFQRNLSSVIKHVKKLMKSLNHFEVKKRRLFPFATEPTGKYLQLLHTQYFMTFFSENASQLRTHFLYVINKYYIVFAGWPTYFVPNTPNTF